MKKLISTTIGCLLALLTQAQVQDIQFIDSFANKQTYHTILLFAETRDTTDKQTGKKYTQRNSYYFDWVRKELRYIDVYDFDNVLKRHAIERAFRTKKHIPSATHIIYTFFGNKLIKVEVTPSKKQYEQCVEKYYVASDMLISQKNNNSCGQKRDLINESRFYLARLQIANETDALVY